MELNFLQRAALSTHYCQPLPAFQLTTKDKITKRLRMPALAIGRLAIMVEMDPQKMSGSPYGK